jgi:hypothetical protein
MYKQTKMSNKDQSPKTSVSSLAAAAARTTVSTSTRTSSTGTGTTRTSSNTHTTSRSTLQEKKETVKKSSLQAKTSSVRERKGNNGGARLPGNEEETSSKKSHGRNARGTGTSTHNSRHNNSGEERKGTRNKNTRQRGSGQKATLPSTPNHKVMQFDISLDISDDDVDDDNAPNVPLKASKSHKNIKSGRHAGTTSSNNSNGKVIDVNVSNRLIGHALGKRIPSNNSHRTKPDTRIHTSTHNNNRHQHEKNHKDKGKGRGVDRNQTNRRGGNDGNGSGYHQQQRQNISPKNNSPDKIQNGKPSPKLISSSENHGPVEKCVQVQNWADDSEGDY